MTRFLIVFLFLIGFFTFMQGAKLYIALRKWCDNNYSGVVDDVPKYGSLDVQYVLKMMMISGGAVIFMSYFLAWHFGLLDKWIGLF